ncbi:MAG: glutamyl-tRNA reductase [Myxococcales bacterium]|nr:glutamyl-tRNA reductase [Myxococcales bacterium]
MHVLVLGLNHRTAPVQVREGFAIPEDALSDTAAAAREVGCTESFVISTCNRVELYAASERGAEVTDALADVLARVGNARGPALRRHLYTHLDRGAITHLFRVAASLDSMVVGEPQILGQLKTAFDTCRRAGLTGPALNRAVERAFAVAKRVRTETGIGRNVVSISSVAVDLARQIFGDLSRRTAALIGAGKMGELAARHLRQAGVQELLVANRSIERAQAVAAALGGHPRELEELPRLLIEADIVITSTGARGYLIDSRAMKPVLRARKYRPIFFIDIAVPRNIDPGLNGMDNVYVYDVDDLSDIAQENLALRRREAELAEHLVADEAERFLRELSSLRVKPTIVDLRQRAQAVRDAELARVAARLGGLDERQKKAVEVLADGIVNKLLHDVMTGLRQSAGEDDADQIVGLVRRLYRLDAIDGEDR